MSVSIRQETTYEIQVQGKISRRWVDWFGGMIILAEDEDGLRTLTTAAISDVPDQAAMLGHLLKLHNLGFSLLQVRRVE